MGALTYKGGDGAKHDVKKDPSLSQKPSSVCLLRPLSQLPSPSTQPDGTFELMSVTN